MHSVANQPPRQDSRNIRLKGYAGVRSERPGQSDSLPAYFQTPPAVASIPFDRKLIHHGGRPEAVFQPDRRLKVNRAIAYPYCAICCLVIVNKRGERYVGTGFLAGPKLILTAGHNVYYHSDGGFMDKIEVFPGLNGDRLNPPLGSYVATRFATVSAWQRDANRQFDIGAIFLDTDASRSAGFLSTSRFTSSFLTGLTLSLIGYPKDPPSRSSERNDGSTMYRDSGRVIVEANVLTYTIDSSIGQSGAPLVAYFPEQEEYHVVGIHNWAFVSRNAGTRINNEVFAQIVQWRKESDQN